MAKLTQKAIMHTFEAMLREMPFDKITVSALVARCDISPNTFYYHYQDIYGLLDVWMDAKLSWYPAEAYLHDGWKLVLKDMVRNLQNNPEIVNHVLNSVPRERLERYVFGTLESAILESVRQRAAGTPVPEQTQKLLAGTFSYALIGYVLKFVHSGMRTDVDEEFDPIIHFLDTTITCYIRQEVPENTKSPLP